MENTLTYEDIRFFRSVARAQAKKDAATRRKLEAEKKAAQEPRQTWGQWLWGTGPSENESGGMTEDQKKELDDIIDFDAEAAAQPVGTTPNDFMKARVAAKLNKGSFSLRVDPHGKNTDIIALVFDSFSADAVQLTESMSGKLALGGFRVFDGTTPDSLYPQIVRVKDLEDKKGKSSSRQTSLQSGGTEGALAALGDDMEGQTDAVNDPFFVMEVEHNPLDGRADNALSVRMRHLEIIYHKGYVESIVHFFKPPESQLESITALIDAAGQTLDGIRKETRAGLEYALDTHKTVDIKLDMNAPIIVIPME
jgi:vacuolar protein sorting-associated protein 13A/C